MTLKLFINKSVDNLATTYDVFFDVDGRYFPYKDWGDHRSAPLSWLQAIEASEEECLIFFDGPFGFRIDEIDSEVLIFYFFQYEDSLENLDILFEYECSREEYGDFIETLRKFKARLESH